MMRWPDFQVAYLRSSWGKLPVGQVIAQLRRSESSVRSKAHALGLSLNEGWFSDDERVRIASLRRKGECFEAIGQLVGRPAKSIESLCRRKKIKLAHDVACEIRRRNGGTRWKGIAVDWTAERLDQLKQWYCVDGEPTARIAQKLGCAESQVPRKAREKGWYRSSAFRAAAIRAAKIRNEQDRRPVCGGVACEA